MSEIYKCTLVPKRLFDEKAARCFLSEVVHLSDDDKVMWEEIPRYDAVLLYAGMRPALGNLLTRLDECADHYKILASISDSYLNLAVSQDSCLLFANLFPVSDFTTAQYYIFAVMKSLQLNPEVSTICFASHLEEDDKMSLYRYFKSVEEI